MEEPQFLQPSAENLPFLCSVMSTLAHHHPSVCVCVCVCVCVKRTTGTLDTHTHTHTRRRRWDRKQLEIKITVPLLLPRNARVCVSVCACVCVCVCARLMARSSRWWTGSFLILDDRRVAVVSTPSVAAAVLFRQLMATINSVSLGPIDECRPVLPSWNKFLWP